MKKETRQCQNCKSEFVIEPDDFSFYEKIKVSVPTFCPDCRFMRKMSYRNESTLYSKRCDLCNSNIIAIYNKESKNKVYCPKCWWGDSWSPLEYGKNYDFNKSFFEQYLNLFNKVPRPAFYQKNVTNSSYSNHSEDIKNCYLFFDGQGCENVMYSRTALNSRDSVDIHISISGVELCYETISTDKCSNSIYLSYSENCIDCGFLYDCKGCSNCFLSTGLRNEQYYFKNEKLTKDEYWRRLNSLDLGSYKILNSIKEEFFRKILPKAIRKYNISNKINNSTGDYLFECNNVKKSFAVYNSEDCKYCTINFDIKDCYDTTESAFHCEEQYECHGCNRTSNSKFLNVCYDNHDIQYCDSCHNSNHLFACIGLRNKQYCILNKQYTKEEYEELIPKIKQHMNDMPYIDKKGRVYKYGEFFPPELSPFAYNETIAQEYFPLTKEQAQEQGYRWKDKEQRNYKIDLNTEDLPDNIKDVNDDILNKVIECAHKDCNHQCTEAFKIIPEELQFYKRMNLPIPRLCPNCRHYERLSQRNPLKLWHRKCMNKNCTNEFETSYAPDRQEIVYCEECYQKEIY